MSLVVLDELDLGMRDQTWPLKAEQSLGWLCESQVWVLLIPGQTDEVRRWEQGQPSGLLDNHDRLKVLHTAIYPQVRSRGFK